MKESMRRAHPPFGQDLRFYFLGRRGRFARRYPVRLLQTAEAMAEVISLTHGEKIHQSMLAVLGMVNLDS
jgi:hypothetical protein